MKNKKKRFGLPLYFEGEEKEGDFEFSGVVRRQQAAALHGDYLLRVLRVA